MRRRSAFAFGSVSVASLPVVPVVAVIASIAVAAGCSLLTSYDGFTGGSAGSDAMTSGGNLDGSADSASDAALCPVEIPGPPSSPDDGVSSLPVFGAATAMTVLDDDFHTIACPLGFDINHGHQCETDGSTPACGTTTTLCNESGGRDDGSKYALGVAALNFQDNFAESIPSEVANHNIGLLVSVGDYNGNVDDGRVSVSLYNVVGEDESGIVTDSADELGGVEHTDPNAYVSGGLLVANFSATVVPLRLVLRLPASENNLEAYFVAGLTSAKLVGQISVSSAGLTLKNAQVTGRVRVQDFAQVINEIDGCGNAKLICAFLDVPSSSADDGNLAKSCDAISFSLGFQMAPAVRSGHAPGIQPINFCLHDAGSEGGSNAGDASDGGDDETDLDASAPVVTAPDPDANPCL